MMIQTAELLTLPIAAARVGMTYTQILRTIERDFFTGAVSAGRNRYVRVEDLEKLRAAGKKAGYLV